MENLKKAYIAGGCFWGMEDLFRVRPGVKDTEVGYLGGQNDNPTYRDWETDRKSTRLNSSHRL